MFNYAIKFTGSPAQKHKAAIKECKAWLGAKRFAIFMINMRVLTADGSHAARLRKLYFWANMNGIQGRTVVHALYRELVK